MCVLSQFTLGGLISLQQGMGLVCDRFWGTGEEDNRRRGVSWL